MAAKLKALKVAELKEILNKASVPYDAKTQKAGLIKKIQESPAALAIASGDAGAETAEDDLLAPPEEVDWDEDLSKSKRVEAPKPVSVAKSAPAPAAAPAVTSSPAVAAVKSAPSGAKDAAPVETADFKADLQPLTVDEELERRKARAAKWGTEVKEPVVAKPAPTASAKPTKPTKIVPAVPAADDVEKVKVRQARFGKESTKPVTVPVVDEAEARKRKTREERFGANPGPYAKKPRTGP